VDSVSNQTGKSCDDFSSRINFKLSNLMKRNMIKLHVMKIGMLSLEVNPSIYRLASNRQVWKAL
jgi:hypothetical protein